MDIKTLLFVQFFVVVMSTIFFCSVYRLRFPVKGPGWWMSGFTLLSVGFLLLSLRGVALDFLSVVVAHVLIYFDLVLFWNGFLVFLGRPGFGRLWAAAILPGGLAHGAFLSWFLIVDDSILARTLFLSVVYSGLCFAIAGTLLRAEPRRPAVRLTGWLFLAYGLSFWSRLAHLLAFRAQDAWFGPGFAALTLATIGVIFLLSLAMILVVSDELNRKLTAQKEALERNLLFREEVESLLVHDLKHPLTPIIYLPDTLTQFLPEGGEARQTLLRIKAAGIRIRNMVNHSLDMFQLEHGEYRKASVPVDLTAILAQAAEDASALADLHGVVLRLTVKGLPLAHAGPCQFPGDAHLLYAMVVNLMRNAVEASPAGAEVLVRLDASPEGGSLSFTNPGEVPADVRPRFGRKYASGGKARGKGLGVYSARLVAEIHGGTLKLEGDTPGQTTVVVVLPGIA